jgi:hypothetical protein
MYIQMRIRIASFASILKVRVVRRATPMVAVRPGSIPIMIPSWVAQRALKILRKFKNPNTAVPNISRP